MFYHIDILDYGRVKLELAAKMRELSSCPELVLCAACWSQGVNHFRLSACDVTLTSSSAALSATMILILLLGYKVDHVENNPSTLPSTIGSDVPAIPTMISIQPVCWGLGKYFMNVSNCQEFV